MKTTMIAMALAAAAMSGASSAQTVSGFDNGVYSPRTPAPPALQLAAYRHHTCVARSRTAMGYWTTTSVAGAKVGALRQCAIRTPRGLLCLVVSCS